MNRKFKITFIFNIQMSLQKKKKRTAPKHLYYSVVYVFAPL